MTNSKIKKYKAIFLYASPMFFIWTLSLLVFWPGMMSHDSLVQWDQITTNNYNNVQPPLHTFFMKFISLFWDSPGAICLVHIFLMGTLSGYFLYMTENLGLNKVLIWFTSIITAFSPINIVMINTVWKDIPYTILVFACSILMMILAKNGGTWLNSKKNLIYFLMLISFPFLFRWNGLSVTVGCLIFVILIHSKSRKILIASSGFIMICFIAINGPLFDSLGVKKDHWLKYNLPIHQMGSFLKSGVSFDATEIEFLNKISPTENNWLYNCGVSITRAWGDDLIYDKDYFFDNKERFMSIYYRKALNNPLSVLNYYRCSSRYIWHPYAKMNKKMQLKTRLYQSDLETNFKNYDGIKWIPYKNKFNIVSDSKIPLLVTALTSYVKAFDFIWKPALFLYVCIIALVFGIYKKSNLLIYTLVPIFAHTLGMSLVSISPEFRFQYPVIYMGHFIWILIISNGVLKKSKISNG